MSELFLEIEEDIKRERFDKVWRKVGRLAVWGSIAVISATAAFVIWDGYMQRQAEAKTSQLLRGAELINAKDYSGAISIFSALTDDYSSSYYPLAMLRKAQTQELNGDIDGAKKTYIILAKGESEFSLLAKLKAAEKDGVVEVATASPFYHSFVEHNAWQSLRAGKKSEAADMFATLVHDENTTRYLARHASEVLRVIAPEKLAEKKVVNE